MYTVNLLPKAENDLNEACTWYDKRQQGLGARLLAEVKHYLQLLENNPQQFAVIFLNMYRSAVLNIFPYLIVYKIDEKKKVVTVMSIFHTSRRPNKL